MNAEAQAHETSKPLALMNAVNQMKKIMPANHLVPGYSSSISASLLLRGEFELFIFYFVPVCHPYFAKSFNELWRRWRIEFEVWIGDRASVAAMPAVNWIIDHAEVWTAASMA